MKRYTDKDLKEMFGDVPQELYSRVRQSFSSQQDDKVEEFVMKRKVRIGLIAAAILLIILMTAAVATQILAHKEVSVNWEGEVINERESDMPYIDNPNSPYMSYYTNAQKIRKQYPLDWYMTIYYKDIPAHMGSWGRFGFDSWESIDSLEVFTEKLKDTGFMYPSAVPEEYTLTGQYIRYECSADGEYQPEGEWEEAGYEVKAWSIPEEDRVIAGYSMKYQSIRDENAYFIITMHATSSYDGETAFSVGENDLVEKIDLPGGMTVLRVSSQMLNSYIFKQDLPKTVTAGYKGRQNYYVMPSEYTIGHFNVQLYNIPFDEQLLVELFELK